MLPSPDILNDYPYGKFVLSNLAAKRAKQLREGAPPLVQTESNHPLTIALAEIAAGKIKPIMTAAVEALEPIETPLLIDENVPAELGMLLPALDENEAALITSVSLASDDEQGDDIDPDLESDEITSLSDLVGDEDEEVGVVTNDDDTLSLSDIADQETSLEDEEGEEV